MSVHCEPHWWFHLSVRDSSLRDRSLWGFHLSVSEGQFTQKQFTEGFTWVSVRDSSLRDSSLRCTSMPPKTFKFEHFPHRFQWKYWCFDMIFLSFFDFGSIEVKVWWKFAWNFHESFMKLSWKFHSDMKVWWNFHETFKALWKFDETFMKLSRHYETFMKLSSCYESFMKVWWNFHETFMKLSCKLSYHSETFMKVSWNFHMLISKSVWNYQVSIQKKYF